MITRKRITRGRTEEDGNMKRLLVLGAVALAFVIQVKTCDGVVTSVTDQATWQSMAGSWATAGFEGFLGSVGTQYPGVVFSGFNGGSPYTVAAFPHQGENSMFTVVPINAGGGGWTATFDTPARAFAFWSDDVQFLGSTISIFGSGNSILGTYDLMSSGGGHGPYVYGFNGFISNSFDIARVEVTINGLDAVCFDDFQYSTPVPVPGAIWLVGSALAMMSPLRRIVRR